MATPFDLMQSSVAALLVLDPDGVVQAVSRGWSEILAWPDAAILGASLTSVCREDAVHAVEQALRAAVAGATESFEAWVTHPAGHQVMLACRVGPAGHGTEIVFQFGKHLLGPIVAVVRSALLGPSAGRDARQGRPNHQITNR